MSARSGGSRETELVALRGGVEATRVSRVVVEEPLEIRLNGAPVAVSMRTPGHDVELASGFLFTERAIENPDAIVTIAHCDENENVIEVTTEPGAAGVHPPAPRAFFANSSCGVCGKASIEELRLDTPDLRDDPSSVSAAQLSTWAAALREEQPLFKQTGSLHAAALFDPTGSVLCVREDVGRHNAVDKVVGWAALAERLPLSGHVLLVSGRCGFEIVQKALVARVPIVAAVSGPSSLAIDLARDADMTLVGFLRGDEMNVYTAAHRLNPR